MNSNHLKQVEDSGSYIQKKNVSDCPSPAEEIGDQSKGVRRQGSVWQQGKQPGIFTLHKSKLRKNKFKYLKIVKDKPDLFSGSWETYAYISVHGINGHPSTKGSKFSVTKFKCMYVIEGIHIASVFRVLFSLKKKYLDVKDM